MKARQKIYQKTNLKPHMIKFTLIGIVATGVVAGGVTGAMIWTQKPINFIRPAMAEDTQAGVAAGHEQHGATSPSKPAQATATADSPKFVTKYTCPMHPQIIEDHPGHCPICGMTLVPKLFPVKSSDSCRSSGASGGSSSGPEFGPSFSSGSYSGESRAKVGIRSEVRYQIYLSDASADHRGPSRALPDLRHDVGA